METNQNILLVGVATLIIGGGIGYFAGVQMVGLAPVPSPTPTVVTGHIMPDGTMMGDMDMTMSGMTQSLQGKTGDDLEKAFLEQMIIHHQGAVDMAKLLLAGTKRPELVKFANDIISAQGAEIQQMEQWRLRFATPPSSS